MHQIRDDLVPHGGAGPEVRFEVRLDGLTHTRVAVRRALERPALRPVTVDRLAAR